MMRKIRICIAVILMSGSASVFAQSVNVDRYETEEYLIDFPGQPKKYTQSLASSIGPLLMLIIAYEPIESVKDDNHVYMIMESKYPDSTIHSDKKEIIEKFFRGAIDGAAKDLNSSLMNESSGNIGKYPTRTIEMDFRNGLAVIKMEMILFKSKLIIIQTITETKKYSNLSIDKFFNSFVLK